MTARMSVRWRKHRFRLQLAFKSNLETAGWSVGLRERESGPAWDAAYQITAGGAW